MIELLPVAGEDLRCVDFLRAAIVTMVNSNVAMIPSFQSEAVKNKASTGTSVITYLDEPDWLFDI